MRVGRDACGRLRAGKSCPLFESRQSALFPEKEGPFPGQK
jgi:hypothetical protein